MLPNLEEKTDPRVIRTRGFLMKAFQELLHEQNFESMTIKDITDKARINRATFYAHFQDKYDLLDNAIKEMFMEEIERRTLNVCSYSPENLHNLIHAVCDFLGKLHNNCIQPHNQFESLVEGSIRTQIYDLLAYWLRETEAPIEVPVTAATWAIYGLASHYSHAQKQLDLDSFVEEAYPYVSGSLETLI